MESKNIRKLSLTVLERLKQEEESEKELARDFIILGLQLSELEGCEQISNLAKQRAYLLLNWYHAEKCEWSEFVDEIKELRRNLNNMLLSSEAENFFETRTYIVSEINYLKTMFSNLESEEMTQIAVTELVNLLSEHLANMRSHMDFDK